MVQPEAKREAAARKPISAGRASAGLGKRRDPAPISQLQHKARSRDSVWKRRAAGDAMRLMAADTWHGMPWQEFQRVIRQGGFDILLRDQYRMERGAFLVPPDLPPDEALSAHLRLPGEITRVMSYPGACYVWARCPEEMLIAWDPKRKLLLTATSHGFAGHDGGFLDGGTVYGEIDGSLEQLWSALEGISHGPVRMGEECIPNRRHVALDVRMGLFARLQRLERVGARFVPWSRYHEPWLVDWEQWYLGQTEEGRFARGGFFDRCSRARAHRLPEAVRREIGLQADGC